MEKTNAERFLSAYSVIEASLNRIVHTNSYRTFSQLLNDASHVSTMVRSNQEILREYAELRNAIVHQRDRDQEIIAEPTYRVTADIERIAAVLSDRHKILDCASKPVRVLNPTDKIEVAYQTLSELGSTKIPVYEGQQFVGLITMEAIGHWGLYRDQENAVQNIMSKGLNTDRVLFREKTLSLDQAISLIEESIRSGKPSPCLIITEHGNASEIPLGILTNYDFPKILSMLLDQ